MKFQVGDLVRLKPSSETKMTVTKEAHKGFARVIGNYEEDDFVHVEWLGKAKGVQMDGSYHKIDFVPYLNGLQRAIKKAKA